MLILGFWRQRSSKNEKATRRYKSGGERGTSMFDRCVAYLGPEDPARGLGRHLPSLPSRQTIDRFFGQGDLRWRGRANLPAEHQDKTAEASRFPSPPWTFPSSTPYSSTTLLSSRWPHHGNISCHPEYSYIDVAHIAPRGRAQRPPCNPGRAAELVRRPIASGPFRITSLKHLKHGSTLLRPRPCKSNVPPCVPWRSAVG